MHILLICVLYTFTLSVPFTLLFYFAVMYVASFIWNFHFCDNFWHRHFSIFNCKDLLIFYNYITGRHLSRNVLLSLTISYCNKDFRGALLHIVFVAHSYVDKRFVLVCFKGLYNAHAWKISTNFRSGYYFYLHFNVTVLVYVITCMLYFNGLYLNFDKNEKYNIK